MEDGASERDKEMKRRTKKMILKMGEMLLREEKRRQRFHERFMKLKVRIDADLKEAGIVVKDEEDEYDR